MTPAKIAGLLQGQASIARKLFEFVPIAAAAKQTQEAERAAKREELERKKAEAARALAELEARKAR